jgi:hypothetical protein
MGSTRAVEVFVDEEDVDRECLDDTLELEAVEDEEDSAATLASRLDLQNEQNYINISVIYICVDEFGYKT